MMTEQTRSKIFPKAYQSPNYVVDALMRLLSGNEQKCLDVLCRKTFGWGKTSDRISKSQITKLTGLSALTVDRCIAELARYRVVRRVSESVKNRGIEWSVPLDKDKNKIDWQGLGKRADKNREKNCQRTSKANSKRGAGMLDVPPTLDVPHDPMLNIPHKSHYQKTESSSASAESEKMVLFYKQNIGDLTPAILEKLEAAQKLYPIAWILDALGEAVTYNKKSWAYAETILKRWKQEGKTKTKGAKHGQSQNRRGNSKRTDQRETGETDTSDATRRAAQRVLAKRKEKANV